MNLIQRTALLPDTKNGSSREVPLSSKAIDVLQSVAQPALSTQEGKVFKTTAESIKKSFERARKRADMEHFNFHDLRHEAITRLFARFYNWGLEYYGSLRRFWPQRFKLSQTLYKSPRQRFST